jgi:hypothetical protein
MIEKQPAVRLVRHGIATQQRTPNRPAEANHDTIRAAGNAAIADALEFLGKHAVVADVQPTIGSAGISFAYTITPQLVHDLTKDDAIESYVDALFAGPKTETSETIQELLRGCERSSVNPIYRDDLLASLRKLDICFRDECFIACLALSGKILEMCLKQLMLDRNISFEDNWMISALLKKIREAASERYLDQSLGQIANIINESRIPAVNSKEKIPVPSREQTIMVIHAVADTLSRTILHPRTFETSP